MISLFIAAIVPIISCSQKLYVTNGESIYRNGKNLQGERLLDKSASQITLFKSCQNCHGKGGDRIKSCNIKWSYLIDAGKISVPYTDSLFFRFIEKDLKSDGTHAETGVHWRMSKQEKLDLIAYLKKL